MVDFDAVAAYVQQGRHALLELLEQEHAAFWAEVQAKIADEVWPTLPNRVEPHHLSTVRRELIEEGLIEPISAPTRGGGIETVLAFTDRADRPGGLRAFETAAARKRLLAARYRVTTSFREICTVGIAARQRNLDDAAGLTLLTRATRRLGQSRGLTCTDSGRDPQW